MKRPLITLVLFFLFTLLTCLCLAGSSPLYADDSEPPPAIPRHRVGHRAKVQDLDSFLAQNDGGDPLAGNYRLVTDDEIFLAARHSSGTTYWQAYDVDKDLGMPTSIDESHFTGGKPAVATGNFVNTSQDDFVLIWTDSSRRIHMDVGYFTRDLTVNQASFNTGEKSFTELPPRVAAGDFDGDGLDEIVMAWEGDNEWVHLKTYDPAGGIHPVAKDKFYDEKVANGNLDIATGDFDGDGNDEVVLAYVGLGNWADVKIYDVDHDGKLSPQAKWQGDGGSQSLAVATGDFNNDGREEIAVTNGSALWTFRVSDNLDTLTRKGKANWYCSTESDTESLVPEDVATGDFNTDGQDEIVATCNAISEMRVAIWASGSDLSLHHKASWSKSMDDGRYTFVDALAVGDVNRDLRAEIVVGWTVWNNRWSPSTQHNYAQVLQVATDLGSIHAKGQLDLGEPPPKTYLAVAVGDLDGDSLRVGPPTYSRVVDAKQLLAVINEPPKHLDVIDGVTYDVNITETCPPLINAQCTYANYENKQSQTTEMSLSNSRDWGISTELAAKAYGIEASLETSYGEGFSKTTGTMHEMSFGHEAKAGADDVIIRTETDYDVWEYPVYADNADTIEGYIAVVFPVKLDPTCKTDCDVQSTIAHINGANPLSFYTPNHENHNVLSYSPDAPGDLKTLIKLGPRIYLGDNSNAFWVEWTDVKDDEEKKTRKQGVKVGVGVEGWGIKAKVSGSYSQNQVSTHKVSFEDSTSIRVQINGIEDKYSYVVDPYVYWSSDSGHLTVDYAAWPLTATPLTWWQNTYDKADPAINLPWKTNPPTEKYRLLSKEIIFDPYSPTAGDQVTVTARVRNYSLVSVDDVKVRLYQGDPESGGVQIGGDQTIPELKAMSSQTVTVHFDTSGHGGLTLGIYAVVDPDNAIEEMHDEVNLPNNNKAYALLPVRATDPPATRPINLTIHAQDINVQPEAPTSGETVHISATVQAFGDAFTYVGVEFWDGNPRRGGKFIGGELIPMILAGESATARIAWDTTGDYGARDIWVGVDHLAVDEDLYDDNWDHIRIDIKPHHYYLPLVSTGS